MYSGGKRVRGDYGGGGGGGGGEERPIEIRVARRVYVGNLSYQTSWQVHTGRRMHVHARGERVYVAGGDMVRFSCGSQTRQALNPGAAAAPAAAWLTCGRI